MTLPVAAADASAADTAAADATADPFGLWQAPRPAGSVSFGIGPSGAGELPAAVWSLDLPSGTGMAGAALALAEREQQVQAIERGLALADARLDALLAGREQARARPGGVSFGASAAQPELPEPELFLSRALDQLEPPGGAVSFGIREDLSNLAGRVKAVAGTDWSDLRARLQNLFDCVNEQLLHFVWVDSRLDGALAARTVVGWSGDLSTTCQPALSPDQLAAHQRSLELALASRSANLKTVIQVSRMAAKITLAVATPLGPVQALALAWEFVNSIVLPMVRRPS